MTIKGNFHVPIYDVKIHIMASDNIVRSIKYILNKYKDGGLDIEPAAFSYQPKDTNSNLYLFFDLSDIRVSFINHEKSHIIDFILESCAMKKGDEARAYLDGYISKKIDLFFKSRKIKVTNK